MSGEKRKKELKDGIVQLVKYNIVGVINTLVDFLVYQLLTYLGMKYAIAQCISYSCGILNSYFFNSRWTFKRDSGRSKKEVRGTKEARRSKTGKKAKGSRENFSYISRNGH